MSSAFLALQQILMAASRSIAVDILLRSAAKTYQKPLAKIKTPTAATDIRQHMKSVFAAFVTIRLPWMDPKRRLLYAQKDNSSTAPSLKTLLLSRPQNLAVDEDISMRFKWYSQRKCVSRPAGIQYRVPVTSTRVQFYIQHTMYNRQQQEGTPPTSRYKAVRREDLGAEACREGTRVTA